MAAPNIAALTTVLGKSLGVALTTSTPTSIISNAAASGKVLKVNAVTVSNPSGSVRGITITWNNAAAGAGTAFPIVTDVQVPGNATVIVVDKNNAVYLEEDRSLEATSVDNAALDIVISYEDIS